MRYFVAVLLNFEKCVINNNKKKILTTKYYKIFKSQNRINIDKFKIQANLQIDDKSSIITDIAINTNFAKK